MDGAWRALLALAGVLAGGARGRQQGTPGPGWHRQWAGKLGSGSGWGEARRELGWDGVEWVGWLPGMD